MNKFTVRVITQIENPPYFAERTKYNEVYWTFDNEEAALNYIEHLKDSYPMLISKNPVYERSSYLKTIELYFMIDNWDFKQGINQDTQDV